ncbi:glucosamine-6-phosphate deaminase [Arthrobacter koreensis]|uniref:glucosamine-6-phosphate deaminase n=1 Tax=Arthrobacter koreensis TaxID=199136 RepID=UPI000AAA7F37|nr:glucosamine-6-phosphate deaminase [Arthrobacter koreensis]
MNRSAAPLVRELQPGEIGPAAAGLVLDALASRRDPVIGVATGSSPSPLYAALSASGADFSRAAWFALDEYVGLPAGHPQSYAEVLRREIIEPLGLDPQAVHLPDPHREDLQKACDEYERSIAAAGGIDLQILGIGRNGHLAFNEPGGALDSRTRVEILTEDTRRANQRFFDSLDSVPTRCLTQGLGTILDAGQLLLIARGQDKAAALRAALRGPVSPECPASVLQLHRRVTVLADPAAASLL